MMMMMISDEHLFLFGCLFLDPGAFWISLSTGLQDIRQVVDIVNSHPERIHLGHLPISAGFWYPDTESVKGVIDGPHPFPFPLICSGSLLYLLLWTFQLVGLLDLTHLTLISCLLLRTVCRGTI